MNITQKISYLQYETEIKVLHMTPMRVEALFGESF